MRRLHTTWMSGKAQSQANTSVSFQPKSAKIIGAADGLKLKPTRAPPHPLAISPANPFAIGAPVYGTT